MKSAVWKNIVAKIKPRFEGAGITRCELHYKDICCGNNFLGFAHAKKRRNLSADEFEVVFLACTPCHNKIERKKEPEMTLKVLQVIANRPRQPTAKRPCFIEAPVS
jgi:hypothetical protein